jgi:hypothetical protein
MSDLDPKDEAPPPMQVQMESQNETKPLPWLRLGAGAIGLILVSTLGFSLLDHGGKQAAASQLAIAPQANVVALVGTLDPTQAQALADGAQSCKAPLSTVQIWHDPSAPDSSVQIKSGGYTSPPILLTSAPQTVALPYPAPYATGAGTLTLLGAAKGVDFALSPTLSFATLSGAQPVSVVWTPGNPCQ